MRFILVAFIFYSLVLYLTGLGRVHGALTNEQVTKPQTKPIALFAWGRNNAGQLGLGHTRDVYKPEAVPTFYPKKVKLLAAGGSAAEENGGGGFSLILTTEGVLYAFGCNQYGQLGIGDNEQRQSMVPISLSKRERVVKIAAGDAFAVALTERGQVYTWGRNAEGELGLGDVRDRSLPTLVSNFVANEEIVDVTAGSNFVVTLSKSGTIWTWGSNKRGQLGNGSSGGISMVPREIKGSLQGINFTAVTAGRAHTLALSGSGEIYSWGGNDSGQLGLGDTEDRNAPFAILHRFTRSRIQSIATGAMHSMALTEKGEIFTFGSNAGDQLGYNLRSRETFITVPRLVDKVKGVRIHAGSQVSMATVRSGKVFVWGCNDHGQLGLNDKTSRSSPTILLASKQSTLLSFAISSMHVLAINMEMDLLAWGRNKHAQLGLAYTSEYELKPQLVTSKSTSTIAQICTGGHAYEQQGHTICRTDSGSVYSWGWNAFGQLGLKTITKHVSTPARLFALEKPKLVRYFSCGQYNSAAVIERNRMGPYTWGPNYSGQLGHSYFDLGPVTSPSRIEKFKTTKFIEMRIGYNHMLGLTDKGVLYAWGSNEHGQLGTGDSKDRTKPTQITFYTASPVRTIAVSSFASYAVTQDNTTFAWGYNEGSELGLGEGYSRNSPQTIHGLENKYIVSIVCGAYHCFAIDGNNADVYAWGLNDFGQLGLGHTDIVGTPTLVTGLPSMMETVKPYGLSTFSAGNWHSALVAENGTLFVWGRNTHGQLGLGKEWDQVNRPTPLNSLNTRVRGVTTAASHTFAMATVTEREGNNRR